MVVPAAADSEIMGSGFEVLTIETGVACARGGEASGEP